MRQDADIRKFAAIYSDRSYRYRHERRNGCRLLVHERTLLLNFLSADHEQNRRYLLNLLNC